MDESEDMYEKPQRRAEDKVPPFPCPIVDYFPPIAEGNGILGNLLKKQLHRLVSMTVVLYLILGGIIWWVYDQQRTNTHALCEVRRASQLHASAEQALLRNNPNGIHGITAEQLQQEIDQYYNIIVSLRGVNNDC